MNRLIRNLLTATMLLGSVTGVLAQLLSTPLEFHQRETFYNLQSQRGVPISSTVNTNIGSDGRMPTINASGSGFQPTSNQFQGVIFFGAVPGLTSNAWQVARTNTLLQGANAFSGTVAQAMGLPVGTSNNVVGGPQVAIILRRGQIGAPFLSRQVSFAFGDIVQVPNTDESGVLLPEGTASSYWFTEPHTTTGHAKSGYYWSPHAGQVYASQSGPVEVTWRKRSFVSIQPPDYTDPSGTTNYFKDDLNHYYRLFTVNYIVSGSPVKSAQKMYWTEKSFNNLGKPVLVPSARVGAVVIAYNKDFPGTVTNQYVAPGETSPGGTTNAVLEELRTLWHDEDQGAILAYNREGRVFVEILGDPRSGSEIREPLGFEIIDVTRYPKPLDVTSELGELIHPPPPGTLESLTPEPVLQPGGQTFAYQQFMAGSSRLNLFATRETANRNDYLVHWMGEGEVGLKWPKLFGRYQMVWPADAARYSHYVRPLVATEEEARATAVPLPTANAPTIEYQDPLDQIRGKLTETFGYYSFLDAAHPAHRALLRFSTGGEVAFERVFSWLDVNLKTTNLAGTVAENLDSVADYLDYPAALANYNAYLADSAAYINYTNYTNYLATRSRGANGSWLPVYRNSGEFTGSVDSNSLEVITVAEGTGFLFTNEFFGTGFSMPTNAFSNGSGITVSGITNAVTAVRLKISGLSHPRPEDVYSYLAGPRNYAFLSIFAGGTNPVTGVHFSYDDDAAAAMGANLTSGAVYKISPNSVANNGAVNLDALLLPAVTEVARPAEPFVTRAPAVVFPPTPAPTPFPNPFAAPRVVNQTVVVGERISAPDGEPGATSDYLAGHINLSAGSLFNVNAYADPFASGFDVANSGAVIPINAIPGTNNLEVWWFRTNAPTAGANAADTARGFLPVYWPSVLGRYTIQWPASPREIVLASKLGSGLLDPFETQGSIYYQNEPSLAGYNPNEEHAIMSGGTAYATRDDLNLTRSSESFVLVDYPALDGRPGMSVFEVLREKPEAGWVFDYVVPAGQLLQAPMPLPLLAKPVEGSGDDAPNYNTELGGNGDLPGAWIAANGASGIYSNYARFTYRDRHQDFWIYRGLHAGLPVLEAGTYIPTNGTFAPLTGATAVVGQPLALSVHVSREHEYLALTAPNAPSWLSVSTHTNLPLTLAGTPTTDDLNSPIVLQMIVSDLYDQSRITNEVTVQVVTSGSVIGQTPLALLSTNSYTDSIVIFSNRPPFLAGSPNPSNSFTMRYYYKSETSFAWPGIVPPAPGSIVPYLRALDTNGLFVGDPASKTEALDIVYRPVWPERDPKDSTKPLPTIPYGLTLVKPQLGLPGVGDWKTARVLYQQSIAENLTNAHASVVLHDSTREKTVDLARFDMQELPAGVYAQSYQGKYYFPNLPPHLANRLYFDPAKGAKGSLVLRGEFKNEIVGEDYLLLNVLRGSDLTSAFDLCPSGDTVNYPKWTNAIAGLATLMETYYENPDVPGTYVANTNLTLTNKVGELAEVLGENVPVNSYALSAMGPGSGYVTLVEAGGNWSTQPGDPVALHIFKVGDSLWPGQVKVIPSDNPLSELISFQHTPDLAGRYSEFDYEWKIAAPVDGLPPLIDSNMSGYLALTSGTDLPRYTLGGAGIQVLGDNYIVLRYRPVNTNHPLVGEWSEWTQPQLAEGWIKRVLAGINPFNQRTKDLFNNAAVTDASILTSAGHRWEGDVALNLDSINDYGLIEIYETVLRRGRSISIESGFNNGAANDALLLAAGYLNDLYMMEGNEAWADAANPTIGIGTADNTYGDIATALFAFKGQVPSLLEEELALLRGRDDFLQPGVTYAPFYNRLIWNYTRGIDAGEVIYALNYNIQENLNDTPDGVINAEDAALLFPQGHGDAYGHYLTAIMGYYSLLLNSNFDWVPRIEAVTVLGVPVSVDYQDERKFAAAAAALGRAGRQAFDLTWRKDYQPGRDSGWAHFSTSRTNTQRTYTDRFGAPVHPIRYWGLDHWANRTGQGSYVNWVVGNAMLPAVDPNPAHEGIQKIDRTTVPELSELATMAVDLQTALDNAEGGLTPLGLPEDSIALDIDPNTVVGTDNNTHFEQIYNRAKATLNNAVAAFDDAKDVTRLMRSEQDSLADLQNTVARQELSYRNSLIELYGTPYSDDMGPGKTWKQGYTGPDTIHYMYAETPEVTFPYLWNYPGMQTDDNGEPTGEFSDFKIDITDLPGDWGTRYDFPNLTVHDSNSGDYSNGVDYIEFKLGRHGFFGKPPGWTGRRASPGRIQEAISQQIAAHNKLRLALWDQLATKATLDRNIGLFRAEVQDYAKIHGYEKDLLIAEQALLSAQIASELANKALEIKEKIEHLASDALMEALPKVVIVGLANGGDATSAGRAAIKTANATSLGISQSLAYAAEFVVKALEFSTTSAKQWVEYNDIVPLERNETLRLASADIGDQFEVMQQKLWTINEALRSYDDAQRNYWALLAEGDRVQEEREVFRQRAAALVQGYRTRDAAFRIFRNEKLERYKTLFDLSARYAFLSANAYDYETGLLNTDAGRSFVNRIVSARALGVVQDGEPQFAGSNTGDPGLSSALAEMKADWDVVKGRLGFNSPDAYGTTVSLRTENFRILPTTNSDVNWQNLLQQNRRRDLMEDADVRRHCLQMSRGDGLPVPGILIEFSTTIANGYNLFGRQLAAGDHAYSPSSFATKIFGVGASLEGYLGMDGPAANDGVGGTSPPDPDLSYLDPLALAATPYVYLIPVGVDSMRSPPLGDTSDIRSWTVDDVAIPLPFNIGASQLASGGFYQSSDFLSEPLFTIRKHQAFRPVPSASFFSTSLYGEGGTLLRSQFTNNRLIGRSAWNSRWKLVIPGHTLLNDPDEGLERFIQTVHDVKLHFVTYSYSGN